MTTRTTFDRTAVFGDIGDLLIDVDAVATGQDALVRELALQACRYVTGAEDEDDLPGFVALARGEAGAARAIAETMPMLDFGRYADMDPTGVFGPICAQRADLARIVMARRMAVDLDRSYAMAFPDLHALEGSHA